MTASASFARRERAGKASFQGSRLAFAAFAAAALALGAQPARAGYVFQDIVNNGDPTFNQELGINSAGTIAGYFGSGAAGHPNQGYTVAPPYGQANFTNENFPGSVQTQVTGINDKGTTVGFYSNTNRASQVNANFGFVDQNGAFSFVNDPNTPPFPSTLFPINQLLGVNNSNVAVGFYNDAAGNSHGYTYTIGTKTFSSDINVPGSISTTTAAINNSGEIAGFYTGGTGTQGFIDNNGSFTTVSDPLGVQGTQLFGLNDNGLAVGDYIDANGVLHGLLYNLATNAFTTLDDPLAEMNVPGAGTTINGINDMNQLVGFYNVNGTGNTIGLLADPVPEPASLSLLAAGLLGLAFVRRRRA